ncbi:MAG: thiol reductant ABC exporter subunit CydD [Chloroflexi bacterium]|nr:thiol reductant ABC exporter subunit CydD [Chloroflexota bacterium]
MESSSAGRAGPRSGTCSSFTRSERTGELTAAAIEGVEALDAYFSQYLPQLVLTALVPLSILLFVFPLDPLSGIVLLVTAPLIPVFMILIGKGAEAVTRRQFETLSRLSAHFLDSLQGLTTLKIFGQSRAYARSIAETSDRFRDVTLGVLRVTFLSALALELIATISTAVVAVEVGLRLLYGHLPFDKALFLLILAPEFYIPLRMLGLRFHAGMAGTTAAKRIYEILDLKESREQRVENREQGVETLFSILSLSALSYTYPGETEPALHDITFNLRAGEHVALVGPSGAGKSTLAAILLRFITPQAGAILVDGRPLEEISAETWREWVAWVPQKPHLFHDTIAANLRIARPEATETELDAAVRAARLDEFVRSLPQGYETVIGEEGARLSGGQAQRLALARAFLKNAPLLILDEPTASLDPQTESLLEESTRRLMQGRTVITIAHRLNTVARANRIVVLQEGRIVEMGSHRELLARGGLYARLAGVAGEITKSTTKPRIREENHELVTLELRGSVSDGKSVSHSQSFLVHHPSSITCLFSFLRGSWGQVALSVLLGALTVAASVGLMGTSAWLISAAALHPSIAELNVAIVGVRFFGLLRGVSRYAERLTTHGVTFRLLARLRVWFYEKLEPLAPRRLAQYRVGDLLNRIVADVETLENFYVRAVAPPMVALVISIGTALFLTQYAAPLAWMYLGFAGLLGVLLPILTRLLSRKPGAALTDLRYALRVRAVDYVQGLADLLAFGRGADFRRRLQAEGLDYGRAQRRMAQVSGLSSAGGVLLSNLGMLAVLTLAIPLVSSGRLDGVMLAVLALMTLASFEALQPLPLAAQTLSSSLASAQRLFEIVEDGLPSEVGLQPALDIFGHESGLQIKNLSFTYPGSGSAALSEVSFDLPEGKKLAIVGPSGAGKSTLFNLLLRFWEAPAGSIRLNGRDLVEVPEETARGMFSVISQWTYLFNATVRENLILANPAAGQAEVEQAARQAEIHDFINGLTNGYETMTGERGLRFSGGERQRLAIARALLKNAPVFLLDEPTADLDPLTGQAILENIFRIARGRALLLITHRLTGLENMDEIIVLEAGRVAERGTQVVLMRRGGLYRRMVDLQRSILDDVQ